VITPRRPFVPQPRASEEDLLELRDPYDLPGPEYPDQWLPVRPEYVIDVTQLWGLLPDQTPSLDQILETGPSHGGGPEPDMEAEP
jgi:hypothetical protein